MLTAEECAWQIISKAIENYESHFCKIFPIYEYISITAGGGYDLSISGGKKLESFIEKRIKANQPVVVPEGYENRIY